MKQLVAGLLGALMVCIALIAPAQADVRKDTLALQENYPATYVVVKGDTLWDISGMFLKSPWKWPQLWGYNQQIDNPHLIYPGDILTLKWVDGQPRLVVNDGIIRLSPKAKVTRLKDAIPAIPLKDIISFLSDNIIMDSDELTTAPYIVGGTAQRIVAGAGDRVYARGVLVGDYSRQNIYRPAKEYLDPVTKEHLGYEMFKIGDAVVASKKGDIISLDLRKTREEVSALDRVYPSPKESIQSIFYPKAPENDINGLILSVLRGVRQAGQYDVVAINKGQREGLAPGHVLTIFRAGEVLKDPLTKELISLPSEKSGLLMVFKAYDKISYALILKATDVVSIGDEVRNPD
ncbi:LysM peptidoglycan-binding domain-containing protein [Amphritea sp. 1_MG-2023]|uniref:LysM peptidoglycan-binding domain-containing protein n=1 Tax=Amphritea sp. 1_MG-2023 TaxID=3062670 RepID=UPI0026E3B8B8|nr:LysM peptidoglycan-binding domain-containing protein [Amphritea sp. 1_MG-2023]MDO6562351.1 LysM peptidoglycan-binding domain-containing protein [Amphritea sp. 1_MG-2023]